MRFPWLVVLIVACGDAKPSEPAAGSDEQVKPLFELPQVDGIGYQAADDKPFTVIATSRGLVFEGQPIASIRDGSFDAAELEGGRHGIKLSKLAQYTAALLEAAAKRGYQDPPRFALMIEPKLPYQLLISIVYSMKSGGARHFELVARKGTSLVALPVSLPDKPATQLAAVRDELRPDPVRAKLTSKSVTPAESSLTAEAIALKVTTTYRLGLERCAGSETSKPTFGARFTIGRDGRAARPKITGLGETARSCVEGLIAGWQFARPKDPDGNPIEITAELAFDIEPPVPTDDKPRAIAAPIGDPARQPLQLVVSVTRVDILLWSMSKLEGSLRNPKKRIFTAERDAAPQLGMALAEIVKRRWTGNERDAGSRDIVFMADATTPMQKVAELLGAMRAAPDGTMLFPDILLSSGFE